MSFCHRLVSVVCHPFTFHILIVSSENPQPNELKLGRKHMWKDLSEECTFWYDPLSNMAATGNSCFWLADFLKSSPLKPRGQMNRNLVGSINGMSSMTIAHFRPDRLTNMATTETWLSHLWKKKDWKSTSTSFNHRPWHPLLALD
jgi:hypothetical protein